MSSLAEGTFLVVMVLLGAVATVIGTWGVTRTGAGVDRAWGLLLLGGGLMLTAASLYLLVYGITHIGA